MIQGVGIDAVEVRRIGALRRRRGRAFVDRVFTPLEQSYCLAQRSPDLHLAGRFALKEAAFKVLGLGFGTGLGFVEVEVTRRADGAPGVRLSGAAARRARRLGIARLHASLSHTDGLAVGVVVAERRSPRR
jgi:holo-[acyl-carrier protein] synthase